MQVVGNIRWGLADPVKAVLAVGAIAAGCWVDSASAATTRDVGAWDLKLQGGDRECRITLRPELSAAGHVVAMPVGCRRAFPILAGVSLWADAGDGKLRLIDRSGQPQLEFEPGPDGVLTATSPEGEIYRLESAGVHREVSLTEAKLPEAPRQPAPAPEPAQATVESAPRLPVPKAADLPGYFSVLREKSRDTGCMVTLDGKIRGPGATLKAHLAPACRDQGIMIFDPVGWQLTAGRLILTARKGHTAKFDLQPDGSWLKDPADGKSMSLKKM